MLIIIDSPGFTHRVARRVKRALPDLPIVNYVCPTVWAWKAYRARRMTGYIDHVLSVLPFEPEIVAALGGPPVTYVGHSLISDPGLVAAQKSQMSRRKAPAVGDPAPRTCLVLPGSRTSELTRLLPVYERALAELAGRNPAMRFVLPAVRRHEKRIRETVSGWAVKPEIVVGPAAKWQAFGEADAAMAASGTVLLELAIAGVPCVSVYKLDPLARILMRRIRTWSAALPNLIADYPVISEYVNEMVRPVRLARWIERLSSETLHRQAMIEGFDLVRARMATGRPPSEHAADVVIETFEKQSPKMKTAPARAPLPAEEGRPRRGPSAALGDRHEFALLRRRHRADAGGRCAGSGPRSSPSTGRSSRPCARRRRAP